MLIKLRPRLLPRVVSSIVIGLFYQPFWVNDKELRQEGIDYLICTIDAVKIKSHQAGIILCGDFNQLPIKSIISCHPDLKQLGKENAK